MKRLPLLLFTGSLLACMHAVSDVVTRHQGMPAQVQLAVEEAIASSANGDGNSVSTNNFPLDTLHDLLVAEFALKRGHYDLAADYYRQQAYQTDDPQIVARATRIAHYLPSGESSESPATLDLIQHWLVLEPDNLEAHSIFAAALIDDQQLLAALDAMAELLQRGGDARFATVAIRALDLPEADRVAIEAKYQALLEQYPYNTQLLLGQALLQQQRGAADSALTTLNEVLAIDTDHLHAAMLKTRLLQEMGKEQQAAAHLQAMVNRHPDSYPLRLRYAQLLLATDAEAARVQFEQLLAQRPDDEELLLSLAMINKDLGDTAAAREYLQRLLSIEQSNNHAHAAQMQNDAHYYLGQLAQQQEEWQTAIEHYQQITAGPRLLTVVPHISALYIKQDKFDQALAYLADLRERYPQLRLRLYLLETDILLSEGQPVAAGKLLNEALLAYPQDDSLLYARALISEKNGDYPAMYRDLEVLVERHPDNASILNTLGYTLADRNEQLDKAHALLTRALALEPDNPSIIDSMGWVEYRLGNYARAQELLEQAYLALPDHEVAAHLGEVLWQQGQRQRAREIWQEGLQNHPDSPIIVETMERLGAEA